MNEPFIRQRGAQLFTTSIDVAEKFGKRHDHVLR
jgi:phage regulator Rha-like protein